MDPVLLARLAALIRQRNALDAEIAGVLDRPVLPGHLGEYLAREIFGLRLADSATQKGHDGWFTSGPLAGRTVNVKYYGKREGLLDIRADALPDEFLVFTGPAVPGGSSRGQQRPFVVHGVYLFEALPLVSALRERDVRIGTATSVGQRFWAEAMVYPERNNQRLLLSDEQVTALDLFRA